MGDLILLSNFSRPLRLIELSNATQMASRTLAENSRFIYYLRSTDDRGIFRVPISGGDEERIVDLKDFRYTGWYSAWFGLDPTDAPLLLRDAGTDEIYALTLEER
jgi:hypothetical protein